MSAAGQDKILGFTKREAEVLITSIQVMRPNPVATNGCTAMPVELVRVGAYENATVARSQYALLRARVMALPALSGDEAGSQADWRMTSDAAAAAAAAATTTTNANVATDPEHKNKGAEAESSTDAVPDLVAGPYDGNDDASSFFLTEDDVERARTRVGLPSKPTWAEKQIDQFRRG